jgi:hypothetical protein
MDGLGDYVEHERAFQFGEGGFLAVLAGTDDTRTWAGRQVDSDRLGELVVTLKFSDFRRTSAERAHPEIDREMFKALLAEADSRSEGKPARLLGVGVRFQDIAGAEQMELFG